MQGKLIAVAWKWIPCQAVTSVLCLLFHPKTVHCSTKNTYTSEITFLALVHCKKLSRCFGAKISVTFWFLCKHKWEQNFKYGSSDRYPCLIFPLKTSSEIFVEWGLSISKKKRNYLKHYCYSFLKLNSRSFFNFHSYKGIRSLPQTQTF